VRRTAKLPGNDPKVRSWGDKIRAASTLANGERLKHIEEVFVERAAAVADPLKAMFLASDDVNVPGTIYPDGWTAGLAPQSEVKLS
jgi:hypothetical protein